MRQVRPPAPMPPASRPGPPVGPWRSGCRGLLRTGSCPRFSPFPGIRYDADRFDPARVTAPPYDVIDAADRAALAAADPTTPCSSTSRSRRRRRPLRRRRRHLRRRGGPTACSSPTTGRPSRLPHVLHRRPRPARRTTGVIGALELTRPGEGGILPHEHTTPKAKTDRLDLLRATRANLSPDLGPLARRGLTDLLAPDGAPRGRVDRRRRGAPTRVARSTTPTRSPPSRAAVARRARW